ncbi:MAG: hypothetical protein IJV01_04295, partial [Bacteroidales bacterium]|nr:hypothetical protein [Bacteroidales bacterium]
GWKTDAKSGRWSPDSASKRYKTTSSMRQQEGKVTAQLKLKTLNDNPYVEENHGQEHEPLALLFPACRAAFPPFPDPVRMSAFPGTEKPFLSAEYA